MHGTPVVHVAQDFNDLVQEELAARLAHGTHALREIPESTALNVLHDDEDLLIGHQTVGALDDSGVAEVVKCHDASVLHIHQITDLLVETVPCSPLLSQVVYSEDLDCAEVIGANDATEVDLGSRPGVIDELKQLVLLV